MNYFQPVMKLKEKLKVGRRYRKVYDEAKTPFERLSESGKLTFEVECGLEQLYLGLNPAKLKREIERIKGRLIRIATRKGGVRIGM